MDKSQTPIASLINHYLTTRRTEGKTAKTLRGFKEKLRRFCGWLDGQLKGFTLNA